MPDAIPQLLTLLAVAKALCVSPHTVRAWVRKGRLRPLRICRRLLFDPAEVSRFLVEARSTEMATVNGSSDDSHC
jgi:excisionase family DNA binding protein